MAFFSIPIAEVLCGCRSSDPEAAEWPPASSSAGLRDPNHEKRRPEDDAEDPEEEAPGPAGALRSVIALIQVPG